jgi:hypothetical protein
MSRGTRRALLSFALVVAGCGRLDYDSRPAVAGTEGELLLLWEAEHPIELMHLAARPGDGFAIAWVDRPVMLPNELRSATLAREGSRAAGPTLLEMAIDSKWTRLVPTRDGFLLLCPNGGSGYVVMTLDVDGARVRSEVKGDPRYYGEGWLTPGPSGTFGVFSNDHQSDPDRRHAFFQPITPEGSPMMPSILLSPDTEQQRHVRGGFGDGRWVVVWQDGRDALPQIRATTVSGEGNTGTDRAILPRAQEQSSPELVPDGTGTFVLTFVEAGLPYYVRLLGDGTAMWPDARPLPEGASSVAAAGARGLTALVWETSDGEIHFASLGDDGSLSEPRALSPSGEICDAPAIAATDAALGVAFRCTVAPAEKLFFRVIPLI